jgi:hypothetical protein
LAFVLGLGVLPAKGQSLIWTQQFGTPGSDEGNAVAIDSSGNALCCGSTDGNLGGPSAGNFDAYLSKRSPSGTLLWTRQIGSTSTDIGAALAIDAADNAYITGFTAGSLAGPNLGAEDVYLAKFDAGGALVWALQTGTAGIDSSTAVAVDGFGSVYVSGWTAGSLGGVNAGVEDAFLAKYDSSGTLLWARQLGTSGLDWSAAVAVDAAGNAYICGGTRGNIAAPNQGQQDAFVAKYDASGTLSWSRQFGTSNFDWHLGVALDSAGNVVLAGSTLGSLAGPNQGSHDVILTKYDSSGSLAWIRQLGTSSEDMAQEVAMDGADNACVTGHTHGSLGGPNAGSRDGILIQCDPQGNVVWTRQFGTPSFDFPVSVAVAGPGETYVAGSTSGSLGGPNAGFTDAFLAKYDNSCTPGLSYCTAKVTSGGCVPAMSASDVPSLSSPGSFMVMASALEPSQNGIMFFGTTGPASTPFQDGTLCVNAPLYRLSPKNSGGAGACSGSLGYTLAEMLAQPQGGPLLVVNQVVNIQTWFRDPPASSTTGLSNGLQVTICP